MADIINIGTKQSGDELTAGEVNQIVTKTNAAIGELNQKVTAVAGKGLSTEDYSTGEKQKLSRLNEYNKGFFANEAAIIAAYPAGSAGWFAVNGETDTVWLWDVEGNAWKNSGSQANIGVGGIIDASYAEMATAIANSTLVPGQQYKISDRGDRGIILSAITTNKLAPEAIRIMLCPAIYAAGEFEGNNWIGVWNANKIAAVGDLTIWFGLVWKCIAEVTETLEAPDTNSVNWQLQPKESFNNGEYIEMIFGCGYDFGVDVIYRQWDSFGNVVGTWNYRNINPCDATDWNMVTNDTFADNKCLEGIYNNSNNGCIYSNKVISIVNNSNDGEISNNSNNGVILNNSNAGYILDNSNGGGILDNSNGGGIELNSNKGNISGNLNNGVISYNSNAGNINNNSNNGRIFKNSNAENISVLGSETGDYNYRIAEADS